MNSNTNIKILYTTNEDIPKLIYTSETFANILNLMNTNHAKTQEFGFMGEIERNGIDYIVTKLHILPQKTTSAYFETDDDKYPEWLGKTFPKPEDRRKLRLQAHSHVNMATSPSGVDDTQIRKMIDNVKDYFIQLIINHKMDNTVNLYSKEKNLIYTNIPEYVKIGSILVPIKKEIDLTKYTKNITPQFIPDLNVIYLNDEVYIDCNTLKSYIADENIIYSNANKTFLLTKKAEKDLNKEIDKMITKKYNYQFDYVNRYKNYDPYDDYDDYEYKYIQRGKKHESKQTPRILQSSKKDR